MLDGVEFGNEVVALVRDYVEREIAPLKAENESLKERIAALEARPAPEKGEDGKSFDPSELTAAVEAEVAKAVSAIPAPKDGEPGKDAAGIVEALKDSGELVLTLQDGRLIRTGIRDGKDGEPGRDGFGFEDMDACVLDDDRTIELSFRRGEEEKCFTFKWPTLVYRGVFKQGEQYEPGDMVTWGGSLHHCNETTTEKPDVGPWTIAAKRGRDGKDRG